MNIELESEDILPVKQPRTSSSLSKEAKIDQLIVGYVTMGLQPYSIVEMEPFRNFVNALQPGYNMISKQTVSKRIEEAAMEVKKKLINAMSSTLYVATTTDCWTYRSQSYVGVTAHWIDADIFERCSAVLACRQLKRSHTLASTLDEIHSEYMIKNKVVKTTTDSGSTFLEAFRVYGESRDICEEQSEEESDHDSEITIQDTAGILCQEDEITYEYRLPKHQRCACHLLNLVVTVDAAAESNGSYKKIFHSALAKCQALWKKVWQSSVVAETVDTECKLQLTQPNQTRWISTFLAAERVLRMVQEEGEDAIENMCVAVKIKM